ncbi:MAG: hypothetical protein WCF65_00415 [Parachlamydiaceae bacterium]
MSGFGDVNVNFNFSQGLNGVQRGLSVAQAVPVVGPIAFSPCKAILSVAQLVTGLAKTIFFGTFALSSLVFKLPKITVWCGERTSEGVRGVFNGTCSLIYSSANLLTLGIVGFTCEGLWYQLNHSKLKKV